MMQDLRLLLVEDNPSDARLVRLMLSEVRSARHAVTVAGRLDVALEHLAGTAFDAVLLDMHLPDSRGLDTVRVVVEAAGAVPVVVLTGLDDDSVGTDAIRVGAQDYLVKSDIEPGLVGRVITHAIERRRISMALEQAHGDLARLNAEKDRFFSIIAHDLKSPFNALLGFSEVLLARLDTMNAADVREYVQIIRDSGKLAYELLENLLEWSRLQLGRVEICPEPVDLGALAGRVIGLYRPAAQAKGLALVNGMDGGVALADPSVVDTVLRNLVGNAVKFTETGGTIRLAAAPSAGGDDVEITVTDSGIGIPAEKLPNLFRIDAHVSTAGTRGEPGTGLGLVLCKELVERSGGTISAESRPGAGTVFRVLLPRPPAADARRALAPDTVDA